MPQPRGGSVVSDFGQARRPEQQGGGCWPRRSRLDRPMAPAATKSSISLAAASGSASSWVPSPWPSRSSASSPRAPLAPGCYRGWARRSDRCRAARHRCSPAPLLTRRRSRTLIEGRCECGSARLHAVANHEDAARPAALGTKRRLRPCPAGPQGGLDVIDAEPPALAVSTAGSLSPLRIAVPLPRSRPGGGCSAWPPHGAGR